ncbi:unnamed protein product [Symbiodinium natans]|uniref:Uncharacterized protein n=1 Tax=Symbiodinium natans TaxID=878477 RepID=A0A812LIH7_9DINO|nr:unnamed protein product [Symbiodinium natans]
MAQLEEEHQALSVEVYGCPKPKHHHRMHISEQAARLGLLVDSEAGEAKHQSYKATLADRLQQFTDKTVLQQNLLPRLLQGQMDKMHEEQPFRTGLRSTPQPSVYCPGAMASRTARTSTHMTITEGDVLLLLPLTTHTAAQVRECAQTAGGLLFAVETFTFESWFAAMSFFTLHGFAEMCDAASSVWKRTTEVAVWLEEKVDRCVQPSWWLQEENTVLCLL